MDSSDYIFSLRALNLWLEDLESSNKSKRDPEMENIILQVNDSFNNVFKKFSEMYKAETGLDMPENLSETMVYTKDNQTVSSLEGAFKREVVLPLKVIDEINCLVKRYDYERLKKVFDDSDGFGRVYLNIEEAEALIELVIIEQKKALLKYPNYDKTLESYSIEHENMVLNVQQGLYEKVVLSITEVFKEFDQQCLI